MTAENSTKQNIFLELCVIDNGVDFQLRKTLDSIKCSDDISLRVVPGSDFYADPASFMRTKADYVMYLYSGTELCTDAVTDIKEAAAVPSLWYYGDELISDGVSYRKDTYTDFSPVAFSILPFACEALILSKEAASSLSFNYTEDKFSVLLSLTAAEMAERADGVHIHAPLIKHLKRFGMTLAEIALLKQAAGHYRAKKQFGFDVEYSGHAYSVVPKSHAASYDVIRFDGPLTGDMIKEAGGVSQVVCFVQSNADISEASLSLLADLAGTAGIGLVSPRITYGDLITYYGSFDMAGMYQPLDFLTLTPAQKGAINCVRSTLLPSHQVFAIKRAALSHLPDFKNLSPSELMQTFAINLSDAGLMNIYAGSITALCPPVPDTKLTGFCEMLYSYGRRYFYESFAPKSIPAQTPYQLFCKNTSPAQPGQKVLVLSHELSLTGAPIVLAQAVKLLKQDGWTPVVLSPIDGAVRADYEQEGIPVIICPDMEHDLDWTRFISGFDLMIVNTIVPWRQIELLEKMDIPVLWWLHDARFGYEAWLKKVLPSSIGPNIHVYSVSDYAKNVILSYRPKYGSGLLSYGLNDVADSVSDYSPFEHVDKKHIFISVGTIIERKGQDILAQAIDLLPEDVLSDCMFYVIGKNLEQPVFDRVEAAIREHPDNITYIESVPHDEIMNYFKYADAVICSSRDDPLPTFMSETMMLGGICICSANTGTASVIENGVNGYVYHNDDPAELAGTICELLKADNIDNIKSAARKTFEENYTTEQFRKNIAKCIDECMNGGK